MVVPDRQETLAQHAVARHAAQPRSEARIRSRLAELAGCGKRRRGGCDPQHPWVPVIAILDIAVPDRILTVRSWPASLSRSCISARSIACAYASPRPRWRWPRFRDVGCSGPWHAPWPWPDQRSLAFVRTEKGAAAVARLISTLSGVDRRRVLLIGAFVLVQTNNKEVREIYIFAGVLVIQSCPSWQRF